MRLMNGECLNHNADFANKALSKSTALIHNFFDNIKEFFSERMRSANYGIV